MNSAGGKDRLVLLFPALSEADARIALSVYRLLAGNDDVHATSIASASGEPEAHVRYLLDEWPGVFRGTDGEIVGIALRHEREIHIAIHHGKIGFLAFDALVHLFERCGHMDLRLRDRR